MAVPQWQVALSGAIPALVAMLLVDRLDRARPEPPRLRRRAALFGALAVLPVLVVDGLLDAGLGTRIGPAYTYEGAAYASFVTAAAVEEACKLAMMRWAVWRRPEFDERMDGIVYAARAGLGFALVENVLYLLGPNDVDGLVHMWIGRAVLAVPGHAMWTGIAGAFAARRRFDGRGLGLLGGYAVAVCFHGAYDLAVFAGRPLHLEGRDALAGQLALVPVLLTIAAFVTLRRLAATALRLDDDDARRGAPGPGGGPPGAPAAG